MGNVELKNSGSHGIKEVFLGLKSLSELMGLSISRQTGFPDG
jgi:hypothetical protein